MALAALELPTSMSGEQRREIRERINQVQSGNPASRPDAETKNSGYPGSSISAPEDAAPDSVIHETDQPVPYLSFAENSELLNEHALHKEEHKVIRKEGDY